jgi:hypothetical protein
MDALRRSLEAETAEQRKPKAAGAGGEATMRGRSRRRAS